MTDKECLIQIINSLGLEKSEHIKDNDDYMEKNNIIILAWGEGDRYHRASFHFDVNGKIEKHEVYS